MKPATLQWVSDFHHHAIADPILQLWPSGRPLPDSAPGASSPDSVPIAPCDNGSQRARVVTLEVPEWAGPAPQR